MARETKTFVLAERPKAHIIPGQTFRLEKGTAPTAADLKDGQVLVEALYLSLDPAMRGWLNDARSYLPPVGIGEKMRGHTIARVLASKSSNAKEGDIVTAGIGWTEVAITSEKDIQKLELPKGGQVTDLLGVLGLTGMTAWTGLERIGKPKAGETVVVSGAAGATGSVVGQVAKLRGCRVVGIAGSDDKCEWLKSELGFDAALNYKKDTFKKDLEAATPNFIDVFWDNVGGEILEAALNRAQKHARFVMCGSISGYNEPGKEGKGIRNLHHVIAQRIHMEGFIVFDFAEDYPRARKEIGEWLAEGKLKRKETIVTGGIEKAEYAIRDLFEGKNTGKLLVEVKSTDE
ncbi:putative NADP-dependent leukotriene b4 12-hydroxydehydrogenase [Rosellinia necatrix]|uniref:Dehydrogenase FUB6 n=1 Tax=Rosellinia necatrix TaxID=77044 RepID=A0A1W2TQE8_ROSNE|nr:putative NADP-dependent leukotriene b4 12-hydroxydehydrogenase [Rosellinia necatrix]